LHVLALDTTLSQCAVAICEDGQMLALAAETMERGHAERIAPMADEVMRSAQRGFSTIDRIIVTTGPGSFTGLRIGLAFARGLAVALSKPCLGVSTLEALALETGLDGMRGAAIAAGEDVFVALYENGTPRLAPQRLSLSAAREALAGARVRGPAAARFGGENASAPDVAALARRAADLDPRLYRPDPLYLREPLAAAP